jgi:hypothetical protein
MPKIARGRHLLLSQFLLFLLPERIPVYISDCIETVYVLLSLPNKTAVKYFYSILVWCEVLTGYLSLGAGLVVTGRISDIGQNVLQSPFGKWANT